MRIISSKFNRSGRDVNKKKKERKEQPGVA